MLRLSRGWLLVFLTLSNILLYVDRGILSALVVHLRNPTTGLGLSDSESGALGSAFMFGYMLTSPLFAHATQFYHPLGLIAIGLGVWMVATAFAGVCYSFWPLLVARALTGIAEASICPIVPPLLMDAAPSDKKTIWLSTYFAAMPIGVALGFIYGESVTNLFGDWHYPFLIESVVMIPFVVIAMLSDKTPSLQQQNTEPTESEVIPMRQQLKELACNPIYICIVLGQCAYVFTVGGLAFWGNNYLVVRFAVEPADAVVLFGLVTVGCGLFGTLLGSVALDYILKKYDAEHPAIDVFRTEEGCKQMFFAVLFSTLCAVGGALSSSLAIFMSLLAASEFLIFMTVGPQGVALMTSVDVKLRSQANAVSVLFMHLLGDFPSPFLIGFMNDTVGVQPAMLVLVGWLVWCWLFWFFAWHCSSKHGTPSKNTSLYHRLCCWQPDSDK